ncbi:serine hydrolase [Raoultibacter massiliensis]|uniref:Serine hydrolase n=1 Tax=Raoultibacter massiliensis TaxID=1852371 RepID=A0ABV1JEY3_9ACTN
MKDRDIYEDGQRFRGGSARADCGNSRSRHTVERVSVSFGSGRSAPGGLDREEAGGASHAAGSRERRPSGQASRERRRADAVAVQGGRGRRPERGDGFGGVDARSRQGSSFPRTSRRSSERSLDRDYRETAPLGYVGGFGPRSRSYGISFVRVLVAAAVVCCVIGGGTAALGALTSGFDRGDASGETSHATVAINGAFAKALEEKPHLAFDSSDLDVVSDGNGITVFSALKGTSEPLGEGDSAAIEDALAAFADCGYHAGFVVLDLSTGRGLSYNAHTDFFSASTIKAPFVAFLWQEFIEDGEIELADTLVKDASYGGTGVMASEEDKDEYALEEVIADTIVYSDNTGYAMLRSHYAGASWDEWTARAGVPQAESDSGWYLNYCACDLARYWLAIDSFLETESEGAQSVKDLLGSTEVSFLRQALGAECKVYAKAGFESNDSDSGLSALNDAGIVESPSGDYLVAVMSDADYSDPYLTENAYLIVDLIKALDSAHADLLSA